MKYALIGCGRISINHIYALKNNHLEFVAMCDVRPKRMDALLEKGEIPQDQVEKFTDYKKMLDAHPDLQLVSIATESGLHAEIAIECLNRGINVIIEKPFAMSLAEADAILAASEKSGAKVGMMHQNRYNVAIQKMRQAYEEGRFGRISHASIHVRWNRNRAYYEQAPWRGTWAQDGGCLMNQCIHGLDLLRWMCGDEVDSVMAQTRQRFHDYLEGEDLGAAVVSFKNGALGIVEGTVNVFPHNLEETFYLFGEKGTVKIGGKSTNNIEVWEFADHRPEDEGLAGMKEQTSNIYGNGHTAVFKDMIEAIEQDRPPYIDGYAGRRALELVLGIYMSQKTGQPVKFPLTEFASVDMRGIFGEGSLEYDENAPVVEAE